MGRLFSKEEPPQFTFYDIVSLFLANYNPTHLHLLEKIKKTEALILGTTIDDITSNLINSIHAPGEEDIISGQLEG